MEMKFFLFESHKVRLSKFTHLKKNLYTIFYGKDDSGSENNLRV